MAFLAALSQTDIPRPSAAFFLYILSLLILGRVIQKVQAWYRLRHVPGPALAGWTGLWLARQFLKGTRTFSQEVPALVEKYGPVVRIAPDKVVCTDIDEVYRVSGVRSTYRKAQWYSISKITRDGDHILSLIDPEERKERKKYIMPAYTGKDVDSFEEGIDRAVASWIELIERKYISTADEIKPMDFEEKAHYFSLDAISEIAYSESFECLKQDRDTKGVLAVNDATVPILMAVSSYAVFWKLLRRWPFYLMVPHDGDAVGFGAIVGHADKIITKRLEPSAAPRRDMLQSFIAQGLRGEALKQEVGIQFFAGSDSVASALYTTLYLLLTHPATYARLQAELDTAFTPSPLSPTTNPTTTTTIPILPDRTARTLPYLQAVLRETLRLFPPLTAAPVYKEVPAAGDTLCGYALPGGTLVATGCAMWQGSRDAGFWGPDAACFRPERWLGVPVGGSEDGGEGAEGAERLAAMHRRVELGFGSGQFVCVGRGIAVVELGKGVAELLRRYNWSLADPLNPPRIENPGVWTIRNFWVRVEKR